MNKHPFLLISFNLTIESYNLVDANSSNFLKNFLSVAGDIKQSFPEPQIQFISYSV